MARKAVALLMMQPAELLQNLGMVGISIEHTAICQFGGIILQTVSMGCPFSGLGLSYVFLLFVDVANLKPDILLGEGPGWILNDVFEALLRRSG